MRILEQKPKASQQTNPTKSTRSGRALSGQSCDVHSMLQLQRTIGNQAVQKLLQSNPKELQAGSATTASTRFGHDFTRIPLFSSSPVHVQPKLTVIAPGDMYEQEADRVADQVMRMPEPQLQYGCPCGGGCPKCRKEQRGHEQLQTKYIKTNDAAATIVPPIVQRETRSSGEALHPPTRKFMESRFGHDFSQVRVHTGRDADEAARVVHARAFTLGHDIVFGSGQYTPNSASGRRLLGHELTHVVQQRTGFSTGAAYNPKKATSQLLDLQRVYGNRACQRMVESAALPAIQRQPASEEAESAEARSEEVVEDTRAGTLIYEIVLNIDDGRVAFLTNQGPAILGSGGTDLEAGVYQIRPDYPRQKWIIESGGVRVGERFVVNLDGALPWTLKYPESLKLLVTHGFTPEGENSLSQIKDRVLDLVDGQRYKAAYELLASLTDVDLVHLLSTLNRDHQAAILVLKTNFKVALDEKIEPYRLLTAMESVETSEENLYIDSFSQYYVDPSSFGSPDEERAKQNKWNLKIYFTYALTPERGITVYADDIADTGGKSNARPHYGPGGLLYPDQLTKGTVPRMWAAKKEVIQKIEEGNFEFLLTAHAATELVLGMVMLGQGLLASTIPGATTGTAPRSTGLKRPISKAYKSQPGEWRADFEGGANMSEEALAYEARVCHKDPGMGYYKNGRQFDGFEQGTLLDAKHYPANKGMAKSLEENNYFIGHKLLNQARRQLAAAGRTPVEWRVSNEAAANKIRQLFTKNQINIKVTYYP